MELTNCQYDLSSVELHDIFRESFLSLKDFIKLATSDEGHHEVKTGLTLEEVVHANEEWMIGFEHNIFLEHGGLHLVVFNQNVFSDGFDRVQLLDTTDS